MVFSKTLHLARQSFAKTLTQGYAQSVVAASQSSYASQTNPFGAFNGTFQSRFANRNQKKQQHARLSTSTQQGNGVKAGTEHADSGLAAYYAAWQKHRGIEGKDWQQFQFAKRIEWRPPTTVPDAKDKPAETAAHTAAAEPSPKRDGLNRAYSASAVDDFKSFVEDARAQAKTISSPEEAIVEDVPEDDGQVPDGITGYEATRKTPPTSESNSTLGDSTLPSSVSEAGGFSARLQELAASKQWAEIPSVFQSMLLAGVQPTSAEYNTLLSAAINLPKPKHQVVPKALDVYSDMLRCRVAPDASTFSTLVELLSVRALDVLSMRQTLEEKRARYGGMEEDGKFMFPSQETEFAILAEDNSLDIAIKLFRIAISTPTCRGVSAKSYRLLISACGEAGRVEDMVRIYGHMESQNVLPSADMFVPMIHAFGGSGDLRSAVECYDEYKALAISSDKGEIALSRKDNDVYAALIRAYTLCGRAEGGEKFLAKLEVALAATGSRTRLRDIVGLKAFIPAWLKLGRLDEAFTFATTKLTPAASYIALVAICLRAADANNIKIAAKAFDLLPKELDLSRPATAMGAMYIRAGNTEAAKTFWSVLEGARAVPEFIEPTAMYTVALIGSGRAEYGLHQGRNMFRRIRDAEHRTALAQAEVVNQIDEAIAVIVQFAAKRGLVLSSSAGIELLWMMIENGGLVPSVASHVLAGFGPENIAQLRWEDVTLLMQVQAGMILNSNSADVAHDARFGYLLDVMVSSGMVPSEQVSSLVEKVLIRIDRPELYNKWHAYRYPAPETTYSSTHVPIQAPLSSPVHPLPWTPAQYQPFGPSAPVLPPLSHDDSFDPYSATTDNKGSVFITDVLEKFHGRSSSHLNEALLKFRNMRRAGRHPRFYTYAKLINAAAKEDRFSLAHEILHFAKQDVPYLPQYRIVRHGWITILDAMVAACLTTGQRELAAKYHQELLDMGAAPSANTFGLYITTLKEYTKTFDEATEAVKIFNRAKAEGVEPSSFLYNALIGKLGKARRIDDCLFYFSEMRSLGIRPTSVTYGTIVNALCRVSDERFAEELCDEMESMPNYKPRPAPYHSMMQFFLTTKRDRSKVLAYYERMRSYKIEPTPHTYKLLIDTYAVLEPVDMEAAEAVLDQIRASGGLPEAVHYASLIHAKGCVQHDMAQARRMFDDVLADARIRPQACLYQALFESMVANHRIHETPAVLADMGARSVEMTAYIANSLIHGWALAKDIRQARAIYDAVPVGKREPSTYEAMIRAFLAVEDRAAAMAVVNEALSRGYPAAVAAKILELVGGGARSAAVADVAAAA